ncbi:MAG: LamG-like jellyroll fold domain-containing protein [Bacteroidota bacterium]
MLKHLQKFNVAVLLLFVTTGLLAQTGTPMYSNAIGAGSSNAFPFGSTTSPHVQFLYYPGDFAGAPAGMISAIYVKPSAAVTSTTFTNFNVRMVQQPASFTAFSGTTSISTGLQTCFGPSSKTFTSIAASGWMKIDLTTPFYYDPSMALIIDIQQSAYTGTPAGFSSLMNASTPFRRCYGAYGSTTVVSNTLYGQMGIDVTSISYNDAGVVSIDSPYTYCGASTLPVYATIKNSGRNQITSVNVNWSVNRVTQTPYSFSGTLDTTNGLGSPTAKLLLGTYAFHSTTDTILVWTSLPNLVPDTNTISHNDSMSILKHPSMTGTYTVGVTGADFTSPAAAAAAITQFGICGPVTINVNPGTYAGRVHLNTVIGSSSTNTISFIGSSPATCIIQDSIVTNPLVQITSTGYVTFRNFTVTNTGGTACIGIAVVGSTSNTVGSGCSIINNIINLPNAGTTAGYIGINVSGSATAGANNYLDSITIDSNTVNGGAYGIEYYGNSTTPSSAYNRFARIRYNTVNNIYTYGIHVYYVYNATQVMYNNINMGTTATTQYGLYHYYCQNSSATQSTMIIGNKVKNAAYVGMYIYYNTSTATAPHKVYDNVVYGNMSYSTNYGLELYAGTACTFDCVHNTVHINGVGTTQYGFYYYNTANVSGINCKNNIFSLYSTSGTTLYPAYFSSNPVGNLINYNVYSNTYNTNLGYRGAAFTTSSYKTQTTGGDSSFNRVPPFVSTTDLHLTDGCSIGVNQLASVPTDIEGIARSASPSPGAYEFLSYSNDMNTNTLYTPIVPISPGPQNVVVKVKNSGNTIVTSFNISFTLNGGTATTIPWIGTLNPCDTALITFSGANQITLVSGANNIKVFTSLPNGLSDGNTSNDTISVSYTYIPPMSGTYTVGGTGANFATISAATTALQTAGVSGPVNIIINAGTYNEQVTLNYPVYGVSSTNTITFDGINAATRTVNANASAPTFMVNQVSYVTVKNLTFTNNFAGTCTGVAIIGNAASNAGTNCSVKKCTISLPNTGTSTSYGIIVTGNIAGIGDANQWTDSVTIDSNTITGGYYGIQISTSASGNASHNVGHRIRWNTLNNIYYYGIRVYYIYNAVDISYNTINMNNTNASNYGIYFYYCQNTTAGTNHKIIGNYISAGYAGLYFYYWASPLGYRIPIYNNMITTIGTYVGAYVYTGVAGGDEVDFYHNTILTQGASTSYGLYYYNSVGTGTSYFRNNIFSALGSATYPAYFSTNPAGNVINFNNYYNYAGGNLGYRGAAFTSTNYLTTTTGGDTSYNVLPTFVSYSNLRMSNACLRGANYTSIVANDIDGNVRSNPPVIGAHEASGTLNDIALVRVDYTAPIVAGLQNLTVKLKSNNTANTTSLNISYKLNSGTAVTIPWTGTMMGCDTLLVTFTGLKQMNILPGANSLVVYTSQPNGIADVNTSNDTAYLTLSTISKVPGNNLSCIGTGGVAGNYVRMASTASMNPTTAFTAEAWVKIPTPATTQKVVSKSSTTNGFCMGILASNFDPEIWTVANGTGSIRVTSTTPIWPNNVIPANTWTHLAVTWQSGVGVKAYINGYQVGAVLSVTATTMTPSTNDLFIGMDSWDYGISSTSNIDEVRMWNVALDSTTIRKNMHRTLLGTEPGLISYVQLNEPNSFIRVCDPISGSQGTKGAASTIVTSTIPVGADTSLMIPYVTSGLFQNANLSINLTTPFASYCDLTITEVPFGPNVLPTATHTLANKYWIVQPFGNPGVFAADLTFNFPTGYLNLTDPSLGLYRRSFYGDQANWQYAKAGVVTGANTLMCFNVDTLGQFTIASNGTSLLPVTLMSFGGKKINNAVNLLWQTANEINSKGFDIERSYNNLDYFEKIAFVDAKGANKASANAYNYVDTKADLSNAIYYRLKQLDNDGKYKYSPIVVIDPDNGAIVISTYPNPLINSTKIDLRVPQNVNGVIAVYDIKGQELIHFNQLFIKGANQINIDLSKLNSGVYISKILIGDDVKTIKLIKE